MSFRFGQKGKLAGVAISAAVMLAATALFLPFRPNLNSTEVALAFLLIVLISSAIFGSRAGLAAAVVGIGCFNFFFLPPFYTFAISGAENWVAFGTFIVTALIAGQLSGYARRRADEAEARKLEIERLYKELQEAFEKASDAEALRRSEKLKSSLLDAVTHDLRTPLTSIKASVTTLLDADGDAEIGEDDRSELLDIIDEETDRLNDFIEGIVGVAKLEAGALHLRKRSCSADEIISIAVSRAGKRLRNHPIEVSVAPGLPNVMVDAASIAEVVFSLLDNAAKYSAVGKPIVVSADVVEPDEVQIIVQDQGKGISPELRESVFTKFYRGADDMHSPTSGLGLGLAIARGIVESQGGRIRIEDGDGDFVTKFVIWLPQDES